MNYVIEIISTFVFIAFVSLGYFYQEGQLYDKTITTNRIPLACTIQLGARETYNAMNLAELLETEEELPITEACYSQLKEIQTYDRATEECKNEQHSITAAQSQLQQSFSNINQSNRFAISMYNRKVNQLNIKQVRWNSKCQDRITYFLQ